jgi:hypothetical protein
LKTRALLLLNGCYIRAMQPVAEAEESRQPLIDGCDLFRGQFTEDTPDSAFVDGAHLIDQHEGLLGEAAPARRERAIKEALAGNPVTGTTHTDRKRWPPMTSGWLATTHGRAPRRPMGDRVPPQRPHLGGASFAALHPPPAGYLERACPLGIDERVGVFVGQAPRPFLKSQSC